MTIVLCKHNLNTTKFMAKIHNEGKHIIPLTKGIPVKIDKRIADRYPSTFDIIEVVEAQVADCEDENIKPDIATDDREIVEPEGTDADIGKCEDIDPSSIDEVFELIKDDVAEDLIKAIDGFKNKKALDEYAAGLGVELDRRRTLKDMKADLKETWNLN